MLLSKEAFWVLGGSSFRKGVKTMATLLWTGEKVGARKKRQNTFQGTAGDRASLRRAGGVSQSKVQRHQRGDLFGTLEFVQKEC